MNERISSILRNPLTIPTIIGVTAFGSGLGLGYILGRRAVDEVYEIDEQLELDFDVSEAMSDIVESSERTIWKEPSTSMLEDPEITEFIKETLETAVIVLPADEEDISDISGEAIKEAMTTSHEPEEKVYPVLHSVFENGDEEWDYELELRNRSSEAPYVLHRDEFYLDEKGFTQSTLTYYSGDNIMVDEDNTPIYNHEPIVGELKFGHGSGDPNVFHVRNERRRAEYEIVLDPGLYSVEVLGLDIENNERARDLKHANTRKFRQE